MRLTLAAYTVLPDDHADPEPGSGAVKITPGHYFNDVDVGKRAGFKPGEMLNMLDGDANVIQTSDGLIPAEYIGLHRYIRPGSRSEEHTSELQSLMRISYAVFCLKKKRKKPKDTEQTRK